MNEITVDDVLSRVRALNAELRSPAAQEAGATRSSSSFAEVLKTSVDTVNANQQTAGAMSKAFEQGVDGVDLVDVMIALQKANLSFKAMTEVRNKVVTAYQEIMNMPV